MDETYCCNYYQRHDGASFTAPVRFTVGPAKTRVITLNLFDALWRAGYEDSRNHLWPAVSISKPMNLAWVPDWELVKFIERIPKSDPEFQAALYIQGGLYHE